MFVWPPCSLCKPLTATTSKNLSLPHNSPSSQKTAAIKTHTLFSLSPKINRPLIEQTLSKLKPLSVHVASSGKSSSNSGTAASGKSSVLPVGRASAISDASPAFGPALLGTGFETLPPLAISTSLFKFL